MYETDIIGLLPLLCDFYRVFHCGNPAGLVPSDTHGHCFFTNALLFHRGADVDGGIQGPGGPDLPPAQRTSGRKTDAQILIHAVVDLAPAALSGDLRRGLVAAVSVN